MCEMAASVDILALGPPGNMSSSPRSTSAVAVRGLKKSSGGRWKSNESKNLGLSIILAV